MDGPRPGGTVPKPAACDPGKVGWQLGKQELTAGFLHGPIRQYKRASCKRIFNSSLQVQVMKRLQAGNVR